MNFLGLAGLVYDPAAPAYAPKWAAILVAALLLRGQPRTPPAAVWCWLGLAAWMFVRGAPEWLGWAAAAMLMLAALEQPPEKVREAALSSAVVMGAGSSVVALWQFVARASWIHGGQGNPDWLGLTLAVALPCSLEWARQGGRARLGVIALELAGLACARSRTAWVAAAVALLIHSLERRRWIFVALLAVVALGTHALEGRIWIWRIAADVTLRHLPFGAGAFDAAFAELQGEKLRALSLGEASRRFVLPVHAHNDWLQVLAEAGLPALILLMGALWLAARDSWPAGRATLAAIAVAALADSPLTQPAVLILLSLVFAASPSPISQHRWWPIPCALLLALALPSWWAQHLLTRSRDEDPIARTATLALAERLDSRSGPVIFEAGLAAAERHDLDSAITHFEKARQYFWQPATEVALGNAWLQKGDADRAMAIYVELLRLQPGSLRARLNLAEALSQTGRLDEAREQLRIAQKLWPSLPAVRAMADRLGE